MTARPSIEVFRCGAGYVARFSAADVQETFEQDTLPTAYTADAHPLAVLAAVARDNPHARVTLVPATPATGPHTPPAWYGPSAPPHR